MSCLLRWPPMATSATRKSRGTGALIGVAFDTAVRGSAKLRRDSTVSTLEELGAMQGGNEEAWRPRSGGQKLRR
jgi:hypothetical protein